MCKICICLIVGIVDHLVQLKGIDINMKDDSGKTILLNMIAGQQHFPDTLIEEVKNLVEKCDANPNVKDNEGRNILHHLAQAVPKDEDGNCIGDMKQILNLVKYFICKGIDVFETDLKDCIPLVHAFQNDIQASGKTRNFDLIYYLLDEMLQRTGIDASIHLNPSNVQNICKEVLETFVTKIKLIDILEHVTIYEKIRKLMKILWSLHLLVDHDFLEKVDESSEGLTTFGKMCCQYTNSQIPKDSQIDGDMLWSKYNDILKQYIEDYSPKFNVKNSTNIKHFSALLTFSKFPEDSFLGFKTVLDKTIDNNVDVMDSSEQTSLLNLIRSKNLEQVKALISKGADINRMRITKDSKTDVKRVLPIQVALDVGDRDLFEYLVDAGANIDTFLLTGTSLILKAVAKCAQNKTRQNLHLIKKIIEIDKSMVNSVGKFGFTPIHAAVNFGRDDADQSLDLETFLIKSGADVNCLDDYNRTPLHYAFTSLENKEDTSPSDPIQIVSVLVDAMNGRSIHQKDIYGCTALHYASQRGATVCSLLLIQRGKTPKLPHFDFSIFSAFRGSN